MSALAYLSVLLVMPGLLHGVEWDSLLIQYPKFQGLPITVAEAKSQQWTLATSDTTLNVDIYWKSPQITHMILFDKKGYLAGIRCGVPVAGIDSQAKINKATFPYTYDRISLFSKQQKTNVFPEAFWYTDILYQPLSTLKSGGRPSLVRGKDEVALGVFFKLNGKWTEVSKVESGITAQGFVKHKCLAGMGQHYFYGITKNAACNKIQGVFVGYEGGKLVLTGIYGFGVVSQKPNLYEVVNLQVAELIFLAERPACLDQYVKDVGAFSSHIYLVSRAAKIACPKAG